MSSVKGAEAIWTYMSKVIVAKINVRDAGQVTAYKLRNLLLDKLSTVKVFT